MKPPKHSVTKLTPGRSLTPPALGAVVQSLQDAGDVEAASQIANTCTPEALANTRTEVREFHNRKQNIAQKVGVMFIDNKTLSEQQQRKHLEILITNSLKTSTPNVFVDSWGTLSVGGHKVLAVSINVPQYEQSIVKKFIESSKNKLGYRAYIRTKKHNKLTDTRHHEVQ